MLPDYPDLHEAMFTAPTPFVDWLIVAPLIVAIAGAALLVMMRGAVRHHPAIAVVVLAIMVGLDAVLLYRVTVFGPMTMTMGNWLPPFGISMTADALGASLSFISALVVLLGAIYAHGEIAPSERRHGFYPLLLLLLSGVSGAFLTGDIFNLYVWFEILLIASFGLIIFGGERGQLDGATKYAFLNFFATGLFLLSVAMLYGSLGTLNMADIAEKMADPPAEMPVATIASLMALGFAMKAAAFPVYFWLPASYHTPRLVVAAMFAGLLTKVGVYALLRSMVMLFPTLPDLFSQIFLWAAILTMIVGVMGALAQRDIRRSFNYLVVSGIGYMLLGLAFRSEEGLAGALFYAIHSVVAMSALYLIAGIIFRMGRSFDIARLGGLYLTSPFLAAMFLILVLAVSGLPPFSGFWPKVVLVQAAVGQGEWLALAAIIITGILTMIALGRLWTHIFWRGGPLGTPDDELDQRNVVAVVPADRAAMFGSVAALVALVILFGIWPEPLFAVAFAAAEGLMQPGAYIGSVFGGVQ